MSWRRILQTVVLVALSSIAGTERVAAQSETPPANGEASTDWHFRYEIFQMLIEQSGPKIQGDPQSILNAPRRSVIILIGDISVFAPHVLTEFAERGGTVLLATDRESTAGRIGEFRASDNAVFGMDPEDWYQSYRDCLVVSDISRPHPLSMNVNTLVVNRTAWLGNPRWARRGWNVVARLPNAIQPRAASGQPVVATLDQDNNNGGQIVLVADPSLFTNAMLWHGDNAMLAINLSQLLCSGERDQVMFVVEGQSLDSYTNSPLMNNPPPELPDNLPDNLPEPEIATLLRIANSVIANVEESNLFNETLADRPRNMPAPYYRRSILFAIAVLVLIFLIWKLSASAATTHPPMPVRDMKSAHELSSGAKSEKAEFGLAASMLARELCRELTGASDPDVWRRELAANAANGKDVVSPKSAQNDLQQVLDLAVNTRTVHISRRRFEAVGRQIQDLRQRFREGALLNT